MHLNFVKYLFKIGFNVSKHQKLSVRMCYKPNLGKERTKAFGINHILNGFVHIKSLKLTNFCFIVLIDIRI